MHERANVDSARREGGRMGWVGEGGLGLGHGHRIDANEGGTNDDAAAAAAELFMDC